MSKPNDNMKKAVIQATLETNTVKNKPDYIKNFIQSNKNLATFLLFKKYL